MEERLLFHNPWWSDPARIDSDKDIKVRERFFHQREDNWHSRLLFPLLSKW